MVPLLHPLFSPDMLSKAQRRQLANKSVGILGLDLHGMALGSLMAKCGIGQLILADPYSIKSEFNCKISRVARHTQAASMFKSMKSSLHVETIGSEEIKQSDISALVKKSNLVIGCFARFRKPYYWLNRISLETQIPVLFSELDGGTALLGPLVAGGKGPCYVCYRLRSIGCAVDYQNACREETNAIEQQTPLLGLWENAQNLATPAAMYLLSDILAQLLSLGRRMFLGQLIDLEAVTLKSTAHSILSCSYCPACGTPNKRTAQPDFNELLTDLPKPVNVARLSAELVSCRTGIVRQCESSARLQADQGPYYLYRAQLSNLGYSVCSTECGFGKGLTRRQALGGAIGEALEIYSSNQINPSQIVYARQSQLDEHAIDPRQLVLFAHEQYPGLEFAPYSEDTVLGWVLARSLTSSRLVYVPAIAVLLYYTARSRNEILFLPSSNGLATGLSLSEAVLQALYEVVERDAFLITWLNRLAVTRFDPNTHPDPKVKRLCNHLKRNAINVGLFRLPTDHSCRVFLAIGVGERSTLPAAVVGLGADISDCESARKAILELVQNHARLTQDLRDPSTLLRVTVLSDDPQNTESADDHSLLYASPSQIAAFDFLLTRNIEVRQWPLAPKRPHAEVLKQLIAEIISHGSEVYYVNLTPNELSQLGVACVRVVVSQFQPMHFGARFARLGGRRLFDLPVRLGLAKAAKLANELNLCPHPLG